MQAFNRFIHAVERLTSKILNLGQASVEQKGLDKTKEARCQRGPAARVVRLARVERRKLEVLLRRERTPLAVARRVEVILALDADANSCVAAVADQLATGDRKYVRKWRDHYLSEGMDGLKSHKRSGHPLRIDAVSRLQVLAMACGKPEDFGVLYRTHWTTDSLQEAYMEKQRADPSLCPMSRTTLLRILNGANIRPHRVKMWLHSPDPDFKEKVTEICELYLRPPPGDHVLCVDEKTGMQALGRKHPNKQPAAGRDARMDYEYVRNGTRKLIAAWNVRTGEVYGEVRPNRRAVDLVEFMDALAAQYPEGEVHIIWDNLNIHHEGKAARWTNFNQRHGGRFHFHYTPIHASWVNQVELWFGVFHRRVLRHGVFNNLEELDEAVLGFISHWNTHESHPFKWTFTGYPLQMGLKDAA